MSKAILFIRVSTEQQSTESQKDSLLHYAMADGFSKDDIIIIEKKESGYKLDESEREGIAELYQAMDNPKVSDVYIWELSRLSRRPKDLYSIRDNFLEKKIQLHCQEPQFKLLNKDRTGWDSNANILFSLFGAMAEQEVIEKKARFARGKKRLAEQGRYNGGAIPYGYKIDSANGKKIIPDEDEEAPIVREIFNMYENGKSQPAIAKELYYRGVKGRAVKSTNYFTISLVHQILTNELLTGAKHLNKGSSYERQYPPIISQEQFERCRRIAEKNNTVISKSKMYHYAHGLIKCTECGRNYVSTGHKGYYHCPDAHNYNKQFDGYEDVSRCPNKTCISTNIIDSLLWTLAIDYEATFVMNEATNKIEECQRKKADLQQKIDAIPALIANIEERMEHLLDALAEGWSKEKFKVAKQKLLDEEKTIKANEVKLREQIAHYDMLISDISKSMSLNYDLNSEEGMSNFIDYSLALYEKIKSITDDAERIRIIQKHIEKVTITPTTLNYKFGKYPEGKDAFAKEITVFSYLSLPRTFVFVPYNGKGGVMLQKIKHGGDIDIPVIGTVTYPEYSVFPMEYLPRIFDEGKRKRREILRTKREALKSEGIDKLRKKGYISMNEMREISKLSYSSLYNAIKEGKMQGVNLFHTWYVKKKNFEAYLNKYKPQPRPYRQTTSVYKGEDPSEDK